jgi:nucleotide-binding universal stress UspA family protein
MDGDTELVLTHAWYLPPLAYAGETPFPAQLVDDMVAGEEAALAAAVRDARDLGAPRVSSRFLTGLPWQQICDTAAADPEFDLIVMGTEGRTGMRRVLLGSVAEKVVRHAPCSVLAVRGKNGSSRFHHILCPIDFSPSSRTAMERAARLADPDGMGITLLHVLDLPVRFSGDPNVAGFLEDLDKTGARFLAEWAAELRTRVSVPVNTRTRIGSPGAQALSVLEAEPTFDLVVVGSHGRTGLRRALLGSVAERIVRHAPCPVFVARQREVTDVAP